jgi:hypothetical protein
MGNDNKIIAEKEHKLCRYGGRGEWRVEGGVAVMVEVGSTKIGGEIKYKSRVALCDTQYKMTKSNKKSKYQQR